MENLIKFNTLYPEIFVLLLYYIENDYMEDQIDMGSQKKYLLLVGYQIDNLAQKKFRYIPGLALNARLEEIERFSYIIMIVKLDNFYVPVFVDVQYKTGIVLTYIKGQESKIKQFLEHISVQLLGSSLSNIKFVKNLGVQQSITEQQNQIVILNLLMEFTEHFSVDILEDMSPEQIKDNLYFYQLFLFQYIVLKSFQNYTRAKNQAASISVQQKVEQGRPASDSQAKAQSLASIGAPNKYDKVFDLDRINQRLQSSSSGHHNTHPKGMTPDAGQKPLQPASQEKLQSLQ